MKRMVRQLDVHPATALMIAMRTPGFEMMVRRRDSPYSPGRLLPIIFVVPPVSELARNIQPPYITPLQHSVLGRACARGCFRSACATLLSISHYDILSHAMYQPEVSIGNLVANAALFLAPLPLAAWHAKMGRTMYTARHATGEVGYRRSSSRLPGESSPFVHHLKGAGYGGTGTIPARACW